MSATNELERHPQYNESDHRYLRAKGYTDAEVVEIWERDREAGKPPVTHRPVPDLVGAVFGRRAPR